MSEPVYVIGIDLGTTNSVAAFAKIPVDEYDEPAINIFKIPQLVGPGSIGESAVLPSFLFLPAPHDLPEGSLELPWDKGNSLAVGEFARDRGAEIPLRAIASTKSWLCHTGVDRNEAILPWEAPEDSPKLSPVEASAAILRHIKDSWNHVMAEHDERLRLENQEVFLTVPASFDAVARDLTVKAAELAGFPKSTLLEEPQAAFYAWLNSAKEGWRELVSVGDRILVADIGGGTTDFSLIEVSQEEGGLALERVAVGDHLLVGGDNMDLTLAYTVANRLAVKGQKLDAYQMRTLCHSCRSAKEHLFREEGLDVWPVTILGRGSRLIGNTIKTELTWGEVEEVLTRGFFPECDRTVRPREQLRTGMREMGLSYTSDPAVTHHLARFLGQQDAAYAEAGEGRFVCPTAVLFNGGVMKAGGLRRRVLDLLSSWADSEKQPRPSEIETHDFDLAVARGAAYYGLVRRGRGVRIRSGLSRTYYIGIEAAMPAVPGVPTPVKALCVAPFGMEEGAEARIPDKEFGLVTGEPVRFDFLGSTTRRHDAVGTVVEDWGGEIAPVATLETRLEGETGAVVPVTLQIKVTEVGTLELWCVARETDRKFKLEFNVRERGGR
ncbi:MAG: Hsp70 family protein [Deltaproteobacteria bacterium]|nr:Hsp70 family protein [Deltaproteobacteria bacterium]